MFQAQGLIYWTYSENHNLKDDLNVTILENNIKTAAARRYHEDK